MNKFSFLKKSVVLLSVFAALCVSCKQEEDVSGSSIPGWTVNPAGVQNLPPVVLDGSSSNVSDALKAAVKTVNTSIEANNLIVMYFDNLSESLVASSKEKYGDLIVSELPLKLTFTAPSLDENTDSDKVPAFYLGETCYKIGSYATTGCYSNSVFRQFKGNVTETADIDAKTECLITANPRPALVIAKDTEDRYAKKFVDKSNPSWLNEIFKSCSKCTESFMEAVSCYKNDSVLIEGNSSHEDYIGPVNRIFNICDPAAENFPSNVEIVKFSLAWTETKADRDGFFFVMYDQSSDEDKDNALQNFDEGVAVAAKYVLENPDTVLVVTSSALDGSSVPAYIWGNVPETAKNAASFMDFIKTVFIKD